MANELKPCPFCGGPADLRSYTDHGGKKSWTVRCRPTLRREAVGTWNSRAFEAATYEEGGNHGK